MGKKHQNANKYLNPPFDPRMTRIGAPGLGSKKLQRGRLISANTDANTGYKHGVHFLFNPVAVSASHNLSLDSASLSQYQMPHTSSTQTGQFLNIGGTSVDLLYDRTYELWDRSQRKTLAGRFGVYSDVLAFYQLLNITNEGASHSIGGRATGGHTMDDTNPQGAVEWQSIYPSNPISPDNLMYLVIGDKLRFYGTVTSFAVTYSHWSQEMIPIRCQVSIGMQFQTDPKAANKTITRHIRHHSGSGGSGTGGRPHNIPGGR